MQLCVFGNGKEAHKQQRHRCQNRPTLTGVADHAPEGVTKPGGDQQDRQHRQKIGQRRGVLERMRRVGIEEPAAVGAELLDRLLGRDRAHRDDLLTGSRLLGNRIAGSIFHR